jgi:ribosome maturation factor RimP
MIDSIGGINVRDCETVSKAINRWLDVPNSTTDSDFGDRYYLEVSSPGLERPLFTPADYERFRGKEARIKTKELVDGRKAHIGFIAASDDKSVTLDTEQGARNLRFADVVRASLVFRGLTPQLPKRTKKQNEKPHKGEKTGFKAAIDIEEEH